MREPVICLRFKQRTFQMQILNAAETAPWSVMPITISQHSGSTAFSPKTVLLGYLRTMPRKMPGTLNTCTAQHVQLLPDKHQLD